RPSRLEFLTRVWKRIVLRRRCPRFDTPRSACRIEEYVACYLRVFSFPSQRVERRRGAIEKCRSGGIGRRAWFRSMYRQRCGGSSPFFGTKFLTSCKSQLIPRILEKESPLLA